MVDIVSIVVAVVALLGTVAQAVLAGWFEMHSEEKKRLESLRATFSKYHDPLHLAASDLSMQITKIIHNDSTSSATWSDQVRMYNIMHTSFVFAQFFAWANILRRDTEFLRPRTKSGSAGTDIIVLLARIRSVLRSGFTEQFLIATGIQSAIGEIATAPESPDGKGQLRCIGFATFCEKWRREADFKDWFDPVVLGLEAMAGSDVLTNEDRARPNGRLRLWIIQHLLSDLIDILDPELAHNYTKVHYDGKLKNCMCRRCAPGLRDGDDEFIVELEWVKDSSKMTHEVLMQESSLLFSGTVTKGSESDPDKGLQSTDVNVNI
ncbi:hypothetical protein BDP27DRAFT_438773 [Rhodocollybia butyracea]|uniref:Uncharacterized protein n=1 Tax=Rhodocollybia butyracea TaxID=206335 RepID=A0A9P5TZ69_9AGAR|nr:hypothetical protein BDP27DRAFT_438773 [Rhodocollybia butyracea]